MEKHFLTIRVVNVETGGIIFSDTARGRTVEEMEASVAELAKKIAGQMK